MKGKWLLILGIPLFIVISIAAYLIFPWLLIWTGIQLEPDPLSPEIRYGEFPFRIEYEIDGKRVVIEDTLICNYDGIGSDEGRGKFRKWRQEVSDGNEMVSLLKVNDTKEIFFFPGSAEYYMGEIGTADNDSSFPNAIYVEREIGSQASGLVRADELLKEYNIKLISWDASQPIENKFLSSNK